ncbi:MAG: DUF2382 domain-containing protein [Acidimicrobiales bacterium]
MANPTKTRYEDWLGTTVYDSTGDKLGGITDVYYDDTTGQPEWMTVSTGWFGTSEQFVPIAGTKQHEDGFRTEYTKDQIKDAPSIDTDQDHLDATEERRLYDHYGLSYDASDHESAYGGRERADEGYEYSDQRSQHDSAAHADTASVTRSEEQLAVDKRQRESGRVRLHKYVVTEDVDLKVPVKRQVARVVREPATGTGAGSFGEESDEEIVLSEEEVHVDKQVVAKEKVGVETDTVTGEETVRDTIRKEKVDVEGDVQASRRR